MEDVTQIADTAEITQPSGLPSDTDNAPLAGIDAFKEVNEEDFTDGKFKGRWNNASEMADYIKNMEDKYSNLNRDIKDKEKADTAEITQQVKDIEVNQKKEDAILDIAQSFIDNGMSLSDEMKTKLSEAGISETDMKLGAYEYKERFETAYNTVGGKEEYDAMMSWASEGLSDAEKLDFNKGLESSHSQFAIEGLHNRYKNDNPVDKDRVRGTVTPVNSIKGYETKAELFRDKAFADSNVATSNDKAKYKARLALTSDGVWK